MRLHDKGLIYKGSYMVNWSPNLQTAVSDLEVSGVPQASLHTAQTMCAHQSGFCCSWQPPHAAQVGD